MYGTTFNKATTNLKDIASASTNIPSIIVDICDILIKHRRQLDKNSWSKLTAHIADAKSERLATESYAATVKDIENQFSLVRGEEFVNAQRNNTHQLESMQSSLSSDLKKVGKKSGWGITKTLGVALAIYIGTGNDPAELDDILANWAVKHGMISKQDLENLATDPLQFLIEKLDGAQDVLRKNLGEYNKQRLDLEVN